MHPAEPLATTAMETPRMMYVTAPVAALELFHVRVPHNVSRVILRLRLDVLRFMHHLEPPATMEIQLQAQTNVMAPAVAPAV